MKQVVFGLEEAKRRKNGKPICLLCDTVKGKGVSFMENVAGWHGKAPNKEELAKGLAELGVADKVPVDELFARATAYQKEVDAKLDAKMPKFSRNSSPKSLKS